MTGKGIDKAVTKIFSNGVEHRECMRHLVKNFQKRFRGEVFEKNLWPASMKRSRFSSKGKSTDTIYNVVDHESNPSHYQLSADIIVIHRRFKSLHKFYNTG